MRSETEIKAMIEFLESGLLSESPEYSTEKAGIALSILRWILAEKPTKSEVKKSD